MSFLLLECSVAIWTLSYLGAAQCGGYTFHVRDDSDAERLSSCTTFDGSVDIHTVGDIRLSGIRHIEEWLTSDRNGTERIIDLPDLEYAKNLYLTGLSEIRAPALRSTGGFLTVFESAVSSLSFPELESVGEEFRFYENSRLQTVSCPLLATVGRNGSSTTTVSALDIVDNRELTSVDLPSLYLADSQGPSSAIWVLDNANWRDLEFPSLTTVLGNLTLNGSFTSLNIPQLREVRSVVVDSTENADSVCDELRNLESGVIDGVLECTGAPARPEESSAPTPAPSPDPIPSPGSSGLNTGAVAGGVVGGVLGLAVVAGVTFLVIRRKRRRQPNTSPWLEPHSEIAQQSYGDPKMERMP